MGVQCFSCYRWKAKSLAEKDPTYTVLDTSGWPLRPRRLTNRSRSQPSSAYGSMGSRSDESMGNGAAAGIEYATITDRIYAITFPSGSADSAYRANIKELSEKLKRSFPDHYKIFNVSQKRSDLGRANAGAVVELGWPDQLAPPLDKLCSICKQIESWLNAHPENIVLIHCKGCRARAAVVVAAYMHYSSVCGSDEAIADRFAMQLFAEKLLSLDGHPSHKRYIHYFANLITGATKVNPAPIHLQSIEFQNFLIGKDVALKVYERMKPVFSSEKVRIVGVRDRLSLAEESLSLRGDLLVKCFERTAPGKEGRRLLFQCQFNTCALDSAAEPLLFHTPEMDLIAADIPADAAIALHYAVDESRSRSSSLKRHSIPSATGSALSAAQSKTPPKESREVSREPPADRAKSVGATDAHRLSGNFGRADSYENFERPEDDRSQSLSLGADPPSYAEALAIKAQQQQPNNPQPSAPCFITPANAQHGRSRRPVGVAASVEEKPLRPQLSADGADSGIGSDSPRYSSSSLPLRRPVAIQPPAAINVEPIASATLPHPVAVPTPIAAVNVRQMPNAPPAVPPKPASRPGSAQAAAAPAPIASADEDDDVPATDAEEWDANAGGDYPMNESYDSTVGRERSVLPAGLKKNRVNEDNPKTAASMGTAGAPTTAGARIEPDLVAKGRYDPQSKCFSYVPAKSLKQHYKAAPPGPRRQLLQHLENQKREADDRIRDFPAASSNHRPNVANSNSVDPHIPTGVQVEPEEEFDYKAAHLHRRPATPKWDDEITKIAGDIPTETDFKRKAALERKRQRRDDDFAFLDEYGLELPTVEDNRQKAPRQQRSPPRRRFGSFSFENKRDAMDELLDPDFYMTYAAPASSAPTAERRSHSAAPFALNNPPNPQQPQRPARTISQRDLDELNDIIEYNSKLSGGGPTQRSFTPSNVHSNSFDRDAFRQRNSRSVNAIPQRVSPQFSAAQENTDPGKSSADDWLRHKLDALRSRRGSHDRVAAPPRSLTQQQQRQRVEQDLLEELKNSPAVRDAPHHPFSASAPSAQPSGLYYAPASPPVAQPKSPQPLRQIPRQSQSVDEPRRPGDRYNFSPNIDELRLANRRDFDHTFRAKTPNIYTQMGTFDRASAVRQRAATPTILMPLSTTQTSIHLPAERMGTPFSQQKIAGRPNDKFTPIQTQKPEPMSSSANWGPSRRIGSAMARTTFNEERDPLDEALQELQAAPSLQPSRGGAQPRRRHTEEISPLDLDFGPVSLIQSPRSGQQTSRLQNNHTPTSPSARRGRNATPTQQIVRQKPPTPPPTAANASARVRTPSPAVDQNGKGELFGKKPQIVIDSERRYQEKIDREVQRHGDHSSVHDRPSTREENPRRDRPLNSNIYRPVLPAELIGGDDDEPPPPISQRSTSRGRPLVDDYSDEDEFGRLNAMVQEKSRGARTALSPTASSSTYTTKSILKRTASNDAASDSPYGAYSVGTASTTGYNYYSGADDSGNEFYSASHSAQPQTAREQRHFFAARSDGRPSSRSGAEDALVDAMDGLTEAMSPSAATTKPTASEPSTPNASRKSTRIGNLGWQPNGISGDSAKKETTQPIQPNGYTKPLPNGSPKPFVQSNGVLPDDRSDTPQFPIGGAPSREDDPTPLPYHPLLYQGAAQNAPPDHYAASANGRSASPRSMYYAGSGHSRRSSLTSGEFGVNEEGM